MKSVFIALGIILVTLISGCATQNGNAIDLEDLLNKVNSLKALQFDEVVTVVADGEIKSSYTRNFYVEGDKLRHEAESELGTFIIIINEDIPFEPGYYVAHKYDSEKDEWELTDAKVYNMVFPDKFNDMVLGLEGEIFGNEIVDWKTTTAVSFTSPGQNDLKVWFWNENGLPIKKQDIYGNGMTITTEMKNIKIGDIDDSLFEK